ncbi:hypothetical protein BS47DRAFT_909210 [Hydnum rufescens UP504]|uniref:Copper transport protein n=1 Tax=Hydnum rufescens UP504 TaxID=1448309 RepID=A0A9P6AXL0_9AGAM|nr:hypothetical protein BS47DRAFT_909210 [Hydnum rufescens UP504]
MNGMAMSMGPLPYLHFTDGDALWFAAWTPTSHGAIAGTCMALALLAILERLLAAVYGILNAEWNRRSHMAHEADNQSESMPFSGMEGSSSSLQLTTKASNRCRLPFISAHDIHRGTVFLVQSSVGYALMLAVMTWNASYIISVILGLGIGEALFGRFVTTTGPHI